MPHPVLTRFDKTLYKDKSANDLAQVPATGTHFEMYRQGATVSADVTIAAGESGASVAVYDSGDIPTTATINVLQVGIGGPRLNAYAQSPTLLSVSNPSNFPVTLNVGTRLLLVSNRPPVFTDPVGVTPSTNALATQLGRATGYLQQPRLDSLATAAACVDSTSSGTLADGAVLTWDHTVRGVNRYLVVAVAWTPITGDESLDSVKFAGQSLTFLNQANGVSLWALANPPIGTGAVEALFGGTPAPRASAVGGALSASGVDPTTPLGTVQITLGGMGTQPSLNVTSTSADGLVFAAMGAMELNSSISAKVTTSPQFDRWSATAGQGSARSHLSGATRPGGGTVTHSWSLSPSVAWAILAVELKPVSTASGFTARLEIDAQGGSVPSPDWLNVRDFATIQAAIDALPVTGGTIYFPAGTYILNAGLIVNIANVTFVGDGHASILKLLQAGSHDIIQANQGEFRIYNMKIDGGGAAQNLASGKCCLVVRGYSVSGAFTSHCYLENVLLTGASKAGMWLIDGLLFTAMNCEFVSNSGYGVYLTPRHHRVPGPNHDAFL